MNDHILSQEEIDALLRARRAQGASPGAPPAQAPAPTGSATRGVPANLLPDPMVLGEIVRMAVEAGLERLADHGVGWETGVPDVRPLAGGERGDGEGIRFDVSQGVNGVLLLWASPQDVGVLAQLAGSTTGDLSGLAGMGPGLAEALSAVMGAPVTVEVTAMGSLQRPELWPFAVEEALADVSVAVQVDGTQAVLHTVLPVDVAATLVHGTAGPSLEPEVGAPAPDRGGESSLGRVGATYESAAAAEPTPSPAAAGAKRGPVRPAVFAPLEEGPKGSKPANLGLLQDVPLEVTVELGRARRTIREILELTRGSVIRLDKLRGDSVDVYVNGKRIARGEVVELNDAFGVRIREIISPDDRLSGAP